MQFKPCLLTTGIGSLPHQDAKKALSLVLKYSPDIPFWPQLPRRSVKEGMVTQFSENIPCLRLKDTGIGFDETEDKEVSLTRFYGRILSQDIDYFLISRDYAEGLWMLLEGLPKSQLEGIKFIKGQITGPFTFAASITKEDKSSLVNDSTMMEVITHGLSFKALWQIKRFKMLKSVKPIIFVDEPYLACFGSGFSTINQDQVIKILGGLIKSIRDREDILLGIHCCANTDWSILLELDFDILSFDAYGFFERLSLYASQINHFLKMGKVLAWGIVPTLEFSPQLTPAFLSQRFEENLDTLSHKGIDRDLILTQSLLTPSCGMGSLEEDKAEAILSILAKISELLRRKYFH